MCFKQNTTHEERKEEKIVTIEEKIELILLNIRRFNICFGPYTVFSSNRRRKNQTNSKYSNLSRLELKKIVIFFAGNLRVNRKESFKLMAA